MPLEVLNATIAVTAAAHNPSILHPSFLKAERIVPENWELSDPAICTPALSVVKFSNGIVLAVEPQKLQVIDNVPSADAASSQLSRIVELYTRTLPFVRYVGVGINFSGFLETTDAEPAMLRFLADGGWNRADLQPETVGVRLVYRVLGVRLRLSFDSGTIQRSEPPDDRRSGVVIGANYHADISDNQAAPLVAEAAQRFAACCEHFRSAATTILQLEGEHATR